MDHSEDIASFGSFSVISEYIILICWYDLRRMDRIVEPMIISVSIVSTRLCRRAFLFLMLWKLMFKMRKVSLLAHVVSLVLCCFGDDDASGLLMVNMLLFKLDKLSILILLVSFPLSELNWLSSDMIDVYSTEL